MITLLRGYSWPGNIRELENTIERALNMVAEDDVIKSQHLPDGITGNHKAVSIRPLAEVLYEAERNAIMECLRQVNGNKTETAKKLGISRTALYEKINKYGL